MKSKNQILKITISLILVLMFLILGTIKINASDISLNDDIIVDWNSVYDQGTYVGQRPVTKTLREYLQELGGYQKFFDGSDILGGWQFSSDEANNYTMSISKEGNEKNIAEAVGATNFVKVYCGAHAMSIFSAFDRNDISKCINSISARLQGNVFVPVYKSLSETYQGRSGDMTLQGLAYILGADLSAVIEEPGTDAAKNELARDTVRQNAIWSTELNKENGGTDVDGTDTSSVGISDEKILTTKYSRGNQIYPGDLITNIANALGEIIDSNPEVQIWGALDKYDEVVWNCAGQDSDFGDDAINDSKIDFIRNATIKKARLKYKYWRDDTVNGDWRDIDSSQIDEYLNSCISIVERNPIYFDDYVGWNSGNTKQIWQVYSEDQSSHDNTKRFYENIKNENGNEWTEYLSKRTIEDDNFKVRDNGDYYYKGVD